MFESLQYNSIRLLLIYLVVTIASIPSQSFSPGNDPSKKTIRFITRYENIQEEELAKDLHHEYPTKSKLFQDTNVKCRHTNLPEREFLQAILPEPRNVFARLLGTGDEQIGVDVTVQFPLMNIQDGAKDLVRKCLAASKSSLSSENNVNQYSNSVSEYLAAFRDVFAADNFGITSQTLAKVRIVSSRGTSGQKCPRWHIDHVPVRLVSSLVGPGCEYIPYEKELQFPRCINRDALNGLDVESSEEANNIICPNGSSQAAVAAKAGDIVLLMGKAWERTDCNVKAAPHKSPKLSQGQPRILLTVDIVPDQLQL